MKVIKKIYFFNEGHYCDETAISELMLTVEAENGQVTLWPDKSFSGIVLSRNDAVELSYFLTDALHNSNNYENDTDSGESWDK